ncbi:UNVERIFIED_CONTAM: hypothetical protein GTU68_026505 [Idotea baltica]|nr:hypothetical protein [Idotea baltica]
MEYKQLKNIVEAALLAADHPLTADQLLKLFEDDEQIPSKDDVKKAISELEEDCAERGYELKKIASGYRYQTRVEIQEWVSRLRVEKLQDTLERLWKLCSLGRLIVSLLQNVLKIERCFWCFYTVCIFKVLLEREWIKIIGHKEVPGRPAMYGTTKKFLDYFNLKALNELPSLAEIKDLDQVHPELEFMDVEEQKTPDAPVQLEVIEGGIDAETRH